MDYRPDLTVYSPDGRLQVAAEVRGAVGKGPTWAAAYRRNLTADAPLPPAPYFLIALADRLYLWKEDRGTADRPPDLELDTAQAFRRYSSGREPGHRWGEAALELLVADWLDELAQGGYDPADFPWVADLAKTGLLAAIRGGRVRTGTAA